MSVVCGRRFCYVCGRWRLIVEFHAREWNTQGTQPVALRSDCMTCSRVGRRDRRFTAHEERLMFGPYRAAMSRDEAVDAGPFLEWLEKWRAGRRALIGSDLRRRNRQDLQLRPMASESDICELAGVSPRSISRAQASGRISWPIVDAMLVATGGDTQLWELYPELYQEGAA